MGALMHTVSPVAAGALIASIWQGVLLTGLVGVIFRFLRGVSPAARAAVWTAVLILVVALPMLSVVMPHAAGMGHGSVHVGEDWSVALLAIWATLSAMRAGQLLWQGFRLWEVARKAEPVEVSDDVARLLESPRKAVLCVSAAVVRPSVTGFFHPRVLLPVGLMETLSGDELAQVVLHEMEHLRRGDDWLNLLQQVSLTLLPLNPALVWLDRRLCRERELACDDGVLRATQARRGYAACLVKLAEDSLVRKGVSLALSALGTRARESELVGRVRRILAGPEHGLSARGGRWALGSLAAGLLVMAGLLARSPEVVSFDAATPAVANGEVLSFAPAQELPESSRLLPVRVVDRPATLAKASMPKPARVVLARAVVSRPARVARRLTAAVDARQEFPARSVPAMAELRHPGQAYAWRTVAAVQDVRTPHGQTAMNGARDDAEGPVDQALAPPARHVVVTEFGRLQPVYAAVPVQGGWLIIQL